MAISRPMTSSVMAIPVQCGLRAGTGEAAAGGTGTVGSDMGGLPKLRIDAVAVEQIVGVKGINLAVRRHEMDAGALHRADAEIIAVEELHDHNAKDFVVTEVCGHLHLRQAAQQ